MSTHARSSIHIFITVGTKIETFYFNTCPAEHGFILFWKHCRSRSAGFSGSQLFLGSQLIRIYTVFHCDWKYMLTTGMLQIKRIKIGEECRIKKYLAWQGLRIVYVFIAGSSAMARRLPLRFVTANMTGHALWQTFANHADDPDQTPGEMPEPVCRNKCSFSNQSRTWSWLKWSRVQQK